jgi:hypothetical protein
VVHLPRPKESGKPYYAKAGNVKHSMAAAELKYGQLELIAVLDADMLAEREWLSVTVPHLLKDKELFPNLLYSLLSTAALSYWLISCIRLTFVADGCVHHFTSLNIRLSQIVAAS